MPLDADMLIDRRRLKRRLGMWRFVALVLAIGLLVALLLPLEKRALEAVSRPQIARIGITGLIQEDRKQLDLLQKVGETRSVAAVILLINSPGGTTTGGEALYEAIHRLKEKKPVVAVMGTLATSAAYLAAIAADRVFARGNTITGSIGVIFQWAEVSELLKTLGVKVEEIKSGALKGSPSLFEPIDEAGRRMAQQMVEEAEQWFLSLVAKERGLDPRAIPGLAEGRVYSGRMARDIRLVDEIGDEKAAIAWLESERNIAPGLRVVDWRPSDGEGFGLLGALAGALARWSGLPAWMPEMLRPSGLSGAQLDGLVSLWHPRLQ